MKIEQFLPIPHCPSSDVSLCAVGAAYSDICQALENEGIRVLRVPDNPKLSAPVQAHADLQLAVVNGEQVLIGKGEEYLKELLEQDGFHVAETAMELNSRYPQEAMLDFVSLRDYVIGNCHYMDYKHLLNNSQSIHVKQGYTKCNLAIISSNALITSDRSIANACRAAGFDVLLICPGFIELPGYSYGFIGGCCGLIAADRLAVCGELKTHPDCDSILQFLTQHKVTAVELCKGSLKDIGGIIPLKQKCKIQDSAMAESF